MPGLLDRRVLLVTGKGGVGKTTTAVALALGAARQGKRVLVCETQGASRVPAMFGKPPAGYTPAPIAPNVWSLSITPTEAIQEYVLLQLHFQRLYKLVFQNRVMGPFVDAVPGLHDLVQLGKVWFAEREMEGSRPRWDLIVVDAPATGHGLSMFGAPRAMMELTRAGPFYENAGKIAAMVEDHGKTALVLVTLAEEMPMLETEALHARLGGLAASVGALVLNEVHPVPVTAPVRWPEDRMILVNHGLAAAAALVDAELLTLARQADARVRLRRLGAPVAELPFLFRRDLGEHELRTLSEALLG